MKIHLYEFRVTDSHGIWGDILMGASNPHKAARAARKRLMVTETESNGGSLLVPFKLKRLPRAS